MEVVVIMHPWFRAPVRVALTIAIGASALVAPGPTVTAADCAPAIDPSGARHPIHALRAPARRPSRAVSAAAADGLTAAFAGSVDGLRGADYQRTVPLPDGRTLWLVQDAFVSAVGGTTQLIHNAAVLQTGPCFTLLHGGTRQRPTSWLAGELTSSRERWFWPLGSALAADGTLRIFLAEMHEQGTHYLDHTVPVATWMAVLDPFSLQLLDLRAAPDAGPALYGWSVASDRHATYLFSQCHRQFGFGLLGHAPCTGAVRVARVPRGKLDAVIRIRAHAGL